jgi:hypothetical protein
MIALLLALVPLLAAPVRSLLQEAQGRAARVEQDLEVLRRELAEIHVALVADRAYAQAEGKLAALRERLVTRTDADGKALLTELDALAAEVARGLGRGGHDVVDEAARTAIVNGDWDFVLQLGTRAVPALVEAVRADPERLEGDQRDDPFHWLLSISPVEADRLMAELTPKGGFFWKKRLLRELDDTQMAYERQRWRTVGPGALGALDRTLGDPDVGNLALWLAAHAVGAHQTVPRFAEALRAAVLSPDPGVREQAREAGKRAQSGAQEIYARYLRDPEADVRLLGVENLWNLHERPELWRLAATDPDPRLRFHVAELLSAGWQSPSDDEAFRRLLTDRDPRTHQKMWEWLAGRRMSESNVRLPPHEAFGNGYLNVARVALPFDEGVLVELSAVPGELEFGERHTLAWIARGLSAEASFTVLERLSRDSDPRVFQQVAESLSRAPRHEDPERCVGVLARLRENPARPSESRDELARVEFDLTSFTSGARAVLGWMAESGDGAGIARVLLDNRGRDRLFALDRELLARCLSLAFSVDPDRARSELLSQNRRPGQRVFSDPQREAFLDLSLDGSQVPALRAAALRAAAMEAGPIERVVAGASACAAALSDGPWEPLTDLAQVVHNLPNGAGNAVVLEAVSNPSYFDAGARRLAGELREGGPGAAEICAAIRERAVRNPEVWRDALEIVLKAMGRAPTLADPGFLEECARDAQLAEPALEAIARLDVARYLPLLSEIVAAPQSQAQLEAATKALFASLDIEAVEPLLQATRRVDEDLRELCIAHLERIREYQDARERWATHRVRQQTREQVIAQLLGQLESQDEIVRVEALRALATWEAVEAMPRIIELAATGSPAVKDAARAALDRLNAPRGE